ncbi:hypothetical protein [Streptomyces violascens]|uniref:hypothetical protein n=1 Tax=Streptomyces violascens TaxID=67381 RepID=UPI0019C0863E|nr:hypothetical protein [Streptomyces violascens]GGU41413.1 hypothetical protein GCM10010289_72920 [Streptomyces violascens]
MKKAIFATAALAIGAGLVGGSAVAASAATPLAVPTGSGGVLGLVSPAKVTPAVVPAADVASRLARTGKIANGSAFDQKETPGVSGVYLDGVDPNASKKATIPVKNPAGNGVVQVHPLQAPTSAGLGSLLGK